MNSFRSVDIFSAVIRAAALAAVSCALACSADAARDDAQEADESNIVGGVAATAHQYPAQVTMNLEASGGGRTFHCSGTLVRTNIVLTAAHCVAGRAGNSLIMVAGDHDRTASGGTEQTRRSQRIVVHPGYRTFTQGSDVALVYLESGFQLNSHIQLTHLALRNLPAGRGVTVSGWGATRAGGGMSSTLRKVDMAVRPRGECTMDGAAAPSGTLCMRADGADACQGDSGGPIWAMEDGDFRQVGIVSYGTQGCKDVGVATSVPDFRQWIVDRL
jgi:trypsin